MSYIFRKSLSIFVALALSLFLQTLSYAEKVEIKFVGVWVGERFLKDKNIFQKWKQTRNSDGTYELRFNIFSEGVPVDTILERGKWWVKDGLFYEKNNTTMKEPDVYKYKFLAGDKVEFIQVSADDSTDNKESNYTFVDTRVSD